MFNLTLNSRVNLLCHQPKVILSLSLSLSLSKYVDWTCTHFLLWSKIVHKCTIVPLDYIMVVNLFIILTIMEWLVVFLILTHVSCFYSFAQRDARIQKGSRDIKSNFSYDIEDIVMPLHKYINDPVAHDIIHNGATFQVIQPKVL